MGSSFSSIPPSSGILSHNIIDRMLEHNDILALPNVEYVDFMDFKSPVSPLNIDQTLAALIPRLPTSSLMPTATYSPQQLSLFIEQYTPVVYMMFVADQISSDGRFNVGLSDEKILKNLKTSHIHVVKEDEGEVCAVCQEEYEVKQIIGTLQCGHRYHENCIKEWLLQKNVYPICKATALDHWNNGHIDLQD